MNSFCCCPSRWWTKKHFACEPVAITGLNSKTVPVQYPIMFNFTHNLDGYIIFSVIHLAPAYHQIKMTLPDPLQDRHKTALVAPLILLHYVTIWDLVYGTLGKTFQHLVDAVLCGLNFYYIDYITVASKKQHAYHETIFKRFQRLGPMINCQNEVTYLGYLVNKHGIWSPQPHIEAISNYKKPETVEELRQILGTISYRCSKSTGGPYYRQQEPWQTTNGQSKRKNALRNVNCLWQKLSCFTIRCIRVSDRCKCRPGCRR